MPASSASSSAASSTTSPREVLSRIAPGRSVPQELAVDEVAGLGRGRHVQRDDVGGGQQLRERGADGDAEVGGAGLDVGPAARALQRLDVDAERTCPLGHAQPDGPEPHDAQGRPEQPGGLAVALLVPASGAQVGYVVRDPPVDRDQQADGQLRDRRGVLAGHVRDQHPARRRRGRVDGVGAGARADHQRELVRGLEDARLHLGAAHDEHVDARDAAGEVRRGQRGVELALVATRLERGQRALGQ